MSELRQGSVVEIKTFVTAGAFSSEEWRPAIVVALETDKMRVKFWRQPLAPETWYALSDRGRTWR